ncbi:Rz1-like lysis system protein LysC [Plesiomonas shigelloides]|uniref:Rz1-like lysis system protein LysC n=2 Tax=Plesiomonas shigelloides TaxID=703 RepID=UPI0039B06621
MITCLMLSAACTPVRPSLGPENINAGCLVPTPCQLPAANPKSNGDLESDKRAVEAAWALCAAKVDAVIMRAKKNAESIPD